MNNLDAAKFCDLIYPFTAKYIADMTGYSPRSVEAWRSGKNKAPDVFYKAWSRWAILRAYKYDVSIGNKFAHRQVRLDLRDESRPNHERALRIVKEVS